MSSSVSDSLNGEDGMTLIYAHSITPETGIDKIVTDLVHRQFKLPDVDCTPWITKLKNNLIINFGLLCRLDSTRLVDFTHPGRC